MQFDLFGGTTLAVPDTEGIKYAGSKLKLLPYILDILSDLDVSDVLDGFSGSTRVSQAFAKLGYNTTSSDISVWSETFATCYLRNDKPPKYYQELIRHLNAVKGYDGWFTEHYGGAETDVEKRPFQRKNTRKLDGIRDEIDRLNLGKVEKAVALTSLILALDSVDSTLGHYAAYLADWSPSLLRCALLRVSVEQIDGDTTEIPCHRPKLRQGNAHPTTSHTTTAFDLFFSATSPTFRH